MTVTTTVWYVWGDSSLVVDTAGKRGSRPDRADCCTATADAECQWQIM